MKPAPSPRTSRTLEPIERHLSRGNWHDALRALLPELDTRAADGDHAASLAARLLRAQNAAPPDATPDTLAVALDRLVTLVEHQETQIRALQALVEQRL